jgi:WD40 repeat protein
LGGAELARVFIHSLIAFVDMLPRSLPFCFAMILAGGSVHADELAAAKTTFAEHVQPIFRQHCLICHNSDDKKGDLALDTYAHTMAGGASGKVVSAGDIDSSRLWALIAHEEEPRMPPEQDRIPESKLGIVKAWILQGALENSGSVSTKPSRVVDLVPSANTAQSAGTAVMPEEWPTLAVTNSKRVGPVTALAASPWAPLVAVGGQRQVVCYDTDSGKLLGSLPFPEGVPYALRFSRNGSLLLAGGGRNALLGRVVVFDVKTGKRVIVIGDELDVVLAADIHPTQTQIALGGPNKVVRVFSTKDASLLLELKQHTDWIYAIEYSPDGKLLASADRSNGLFVWDTNNGREHYRLTGHSAAVTDVTWRDDSKILATASLDGTIRIWDIDTGKSIKSWPAHPEGVEAIEFSHDGRLVSTGRDCTTKLWDVNGKLIQDFERFSDYGIEATFIFHGRQIATGDFLGKCQLWEVERKQSRLTLTPF